MFRITHIDSIPHILRHGLVTHYAVNTNKAFVSIGDS
ncbi:DarT ssDNA thymidine ADP-ribosyltransferase family protein [Chlorobaculum limnaeum]